VVAKGALVAHGSGPGAQFAYNRETTVQSFATRGYMIDRRKFVALLSAVPLIGKTMLAVCPNDKPPFRRDMYNAAFAANTTARPMPAICCGIAAPRRLEKSS
jgi:hypothetical protein